MRRCAPAYTRGCRCGRGRAAEATGYNRDALAALVRDLRAGKLTIFAPPGVPGR